MTMPMTKFTRAELLGSGGGYLVENTRSQGVGLLPVLMKSGYPKNIAAALAAEEVDWGYPAEYRAKAAAERARTRPVWATPQGLSIGAPAHELGLHNIDMDAESWILNRGFLSDMIRQMDIPSYSAMGLPLFSTFDGSRSITPMVVDLDLDVARRVSSVCLGYVVPDEQISLAKLELFEYMPSAGGMGNFGEFALKYVGVNPAADSFTFVHISEVFRTALAFRFVGLTRPLTVNAIVAHQHWNAAQIGGNGSNGKQWHDDIIFPLDAVVNGVAFDVVRKDVRCVTSNDLSNDKYQILTASTSTSWSAGKGYPATIRYSSVYNGPTGFESFCQDKIKYGRFYLFGWHPFLKAAHAIGGTVINDQAGAISIEQNLVGVEWLGSDLKGIMNNPSAADIATLEKMHVVSGFNMTGAWTHPTNPLVNTDLWKMANEAGEAGTVENETFAPADPTRGNPAFTFAQASSRASGKQFTVAHAMKRLVVPDDITSVVVTGTISNEGVANYSHLAYASAGGLAASQDVNLCIDAIRRRAPLTFSLASGLTAEDACLAVFGISRNDMKARTLYDRKDAARNEFDENVIFGPYIPNPTSAMPLNSRSAFAMIHETPVRSNITEVSGGMLAIMYNMQKRIKSA